MIPLDIEDSSQNRGTLRLRICWVLLAVWTASFWLAAALPGTALGASAAGLQFLAFLIFVLVHASLQVGWKGAFLYAALIYAVSFVLEASSVATGFPFGFFEHHTAIGPKPFGIPLVVPLGYLVFGWPAWVMARAVIDAITGGSRAGIIFAAPIAASFMLAGYDYVFDAINATVLKIHSYRFPTGLLGVPLTNFLGWLLTGWCAYQLFALAVQKLPGTPASATRAFGLQACLLWIGLALGYAIQFVIAPPGVTQVGSRTFVVADIYEAAVAISLPAMFFPALLAMFAICARRVSA